MRALRTCDSGIHFAPLSAQGAERACAAWPQPPRGPVAPCPHAPCPPAPLAPATHAPATPWLPSETPPSGVHGAHTCTALTQGRLQLLGAALQGR